MTQEFLSEEFEGLGRDLGKTCFLCGSQYRLEVDHFNEDHSGNTRNNKWFLCKYHHSLKTKTDRELFKILTNACTADPKLKRTMRNVAEKWMLEYKDASRFPFKASILSDPQKDKDVYKPREVGEIIQGIAMQYNDIKDTDEIIKLLGWFWK